MTARGHKNNPEPTVTRGQVWHPRAGALSLEVLSVDGQRARVRKFSPSGKYPSNSRQEPFEVEVATRSIRNDYRFERKEAHDAT